MGGPCGRGGSLIGSSAMEPANIALACGVAFLAGFVDAVAGGGGLIQLPALLLLLPEAGVVTLLGTNKVASACGTGAALLRYSRQIAIPWRVVLPAAGLAFLGSMGGARGSTLLPAVALKPIVVGLLFAVAAWTTLRRDLGTEPRPARPHAGLVAAFIGLLLGFYDGFFGPGTGTFLLFLFVSTLSLDFLAASSSAKVVNLATNLAALVVFLPRGNVLWALALPMAAFNVLGATLGARAAIARGSPFVRRVFQGVTAALLLKLAADVLVPPFGG